MPARTLYALTGAFNSIPATIFARKVLLIEDASGSGAGLKVKFPADGFTAAYEYGPVAQPVILGDQAVFGRGEGTLLGWPAQSGANQRAADVYCEVASMGASTVLRVEEYE